VPTQSTTSEVADTAEAERVLLARIADGERDLPLIELYRIYGRQLYALGVRMLGDGSAAEELVQEVFVRVWQNAARFDEQRASPRTWIFMLARNTAIDMHRRAAARPRRAEGDGLDALTVADETDRLVLGIGVRDALTTLPHAHREVLELAYDQQMTQREIAEHLEIPLGTVKTRTYHALRELKDRLEERRLL
jgi:RNA polymerase sigma-70 factor (ECF subfamily)